MSRDETVMRDYRNGSSQERMDIYLAYPGLRIQFDEIERGEERRPSPVKATNGKHRLWRLFRPLASG